MSYHDFANMSNRLKGENLQLNIELHQGATSGSLLAFPVLGSLSINISKGVSKIKWVIRQNKQKEKNSKNIYQ